jgi:hypothetical protein
MGKLKNWEIVNKRDYNKWLNENKYYDSNWVIKQVALENQILEDETVNSIKPLSQKTKRSGKFNQQTFIVCYNFKLKYGYYMNTKNHFKFLRPKQIEEFKVKVANKDLNFNTIWIKDNRKFGKYNNMNGFLSMGKATTSKIEQKFSNKIAIYSKYKKGLIKTQKDLDQNYEQLFKKLKIYEIKM